MQMPGETSWFFTFKGHDVTIGCLLWLTSVKKKVIRLFKEIMYYIIKCNYVINYKCYLKNDTWSYSTLLSFYYCNGQYLITSANILRSDDVTFFKKPRNNFRNISYFMILFHVTQVIWYCPTLKYTLAYKCIHCFLIA